MSQADLTQSGTPRSALAPLETSQRGEPGAGEGGPPPRPPRPWLLRKRLWLLGLPVAGLSFLITIAPPLPAAGPIPGSRFSPDDGRPFHYLPAPEAYVLDFDPRQVRIDLLEGWDREQQAFADRQALAFVSGPMYERHVTGSGREYTVPLGDLKLGERIWRGPNRTAARQRAYVGIRHDGGVEFGYGELTAQRADRYDSFIGGLHSIYNDLETPPATYRGAYSISMGQQIRYYLPRIRVLYGLRPDGRLEVLMSRDGLTLEQTRSLARSRGLRAAYLPDHASKSRFIIPGIKGFSDEDANWISGGATSFVHVPYMLRLSQRPTPLQGSLLPVLAGLPGTDGCSGPLACGQNLGGQLLDRLLAGFNRFVEQGVQPLARLIWSPRGIRSPGSAGAEPPWREPPISADPLALQVRQQREAAGEALTAATAAPLDLPSHNTMPAPLVVAPGAPLRPAAADGIETPAGKGAIADGQGSNGGPEASAAGDGGTAQGSGDGVAPGPSTDPALPPPLATDPPGAASPAAPSEAGGRPGAPPG